MNLKLDKYSSHFQKAKADNISSDVGYTVIRD